MADAEIPLFKYMKKEHAKLFREMGTIRIGTFDEYHRVDILGSEIGDDTDGVAFCRVNKEDLENIKKDVTQQSRMGTFVRDLVLSSPEASLFETFYANYWPPNQYMYCATESFSADSMEQMGYDACVRIDHPGKFFDLVGLMLQLSARFVGAYRCQYRSRGYTYEEASSIFPEIIKPPRYSHQREVRAIWYPFYPRELSDYHPVERPLPPIMSLVIPCPSLIECCTVL